LPTKELLKSFYLSSTCAKHFSKLYNSAGAWVQASRGMDAFNKWFSNEILKIELISQFDGVIKGKVQFVVNTDGSLSDIYILENNFPQISETVVEILKNSPTWSPKVAVIENYYSNFYKQRIELPFEIKVK
jgi:hypothetical protein